MSTTVKANDLARRAESCMGWRYELGKSEKGVVDCSGLIVYLMTISGGRIPFHGSNTMFRTDMVDFVPDEKAAPGMLAFKVRAWTDNYDHHKYYGDAPGDVYHVGVVSSDGKVIHAANKRQGVMKSATSDWKFFGKLKGVDYTAVSEKTAYEKLLDELQEIIDKYKKDVLFNG